MSRTAPQLPLHIVFPIAILALCLVSSPAVAQLAPTGGHYGGQPSDTGFGGSVGGMGAYGVSVTLELPPVRGGLPLPVSVSYGARGVGAAGLGWDVPLSYVRFDNFILHRRPHISFGIR